MSQSFVWAQRHLMVTCGIVEGGLRRRHRTALWLCNGHRFVKCCPAHTGMTPCGGRDRPLSHDLKLPDHVVTVAQVSGVSHPCPTAGRTARAGAPVGQASDALQAASGGERGLALGLL